MFQLSRPDFMYSVYRPDLHALGAIDGRPPSGLPQDNNDALSRRDMGLEFLDVTAQAYLAINTDRRPGGGRQEDEVRITNNSTTGIDTHLLVIVQGLPKEVRLANASGITAAGEPYLRVFLPKGELLPGQSIAEALRFERGRSRDGRDARDDDDRQGRRAQPVRYTLRLLSGQGKP